MYAELKRAGKIKREDSWEKFVNPLKIGIDNHMQKALNSANADQIKNRKGTNDEDETAKLAQSKGKSKKSSTGDDHIADTGWNKKEKATFRNNFERFQYQFSSEKV